MSVALGEKLRALYEVVRRHGLSTGGFSERAGVAEGDMLGMWSALATELLRLSDILRSWGEVTDADLVSATAKELKGEVARNWLGRAIAAAFVEDKVAAAKYARRCLDAMDWSPGYGPPSLTARLQMAQLVADAYVDGLLGAQRGERVRKLLYWQCSLLPLPTSARTLGRGRLLDLAAVENDATKRLYGGHFVDALVFVADRMQSGGARAGHGVLPEDAASDHKTTRTGYVRELLAAGQDILGEHLDCAFHAARFWAAAAFDDRLLVRPALLKARWALTLLERFEKGETGVYVTDEESMALLAGARRKHLHELVERLRALG